MDMKPSNRIRVALGFQLLFAFALLNTLGAAQWRALHYHIFYEPALFHPRILPAAIFCIAVPLLVLIASFFALCGRRWAFRVSFVCQLLIALAAGAYCIPAVFYMFSRVKQAWALWAPWFFMASAPVLIAAIVLAIIFYRCLANTKSNGNGS